MVISLNPPNPVTAWRAGRERRRGGEKREGDGGRGRKREEEGRRGRKREEEGGEEEGGGNTVREGEKSYVYIILVCHNSINTTRNV